ncbi:telomerase Cajal body protein 1 homolog [Helicoverpa zea]|uniref:telomerase Cajal body protein 1 homolog n=1 Tax=Helicoverpa zea TaxID=7113 RepID=UPI001F59A6E8|nr:telomerase Cajal body protein 1 homolog [Helicoverpa zea]
MGEISMEIQSVDAGEPLSQDEAAAAVVENAEALVTDEQNFYQYPSLFTSKTLIELSNSSWSRSAKAKNDVQPYLRGCKWSPDGTCCLTVVNNDGVHVTELSRDLYTGSVAANRIIDVMDSVIHVKEAGLVYDFCWFPLMNSQVPESCCWLTTRQNAPIQMWDAFDGSLRCSYRGFNAVDQMEPAISVTFTKDGSKIIAGYKKYLRTFDVDRPGRDFAEHKIGSPAACFDTCDNLLAVGSWNTSISLYNVNEMGTYKSIGKMHGHGGGVTQVKFAPDGLRLVSGARKDHRLLVWDIRYYRRPLNILSRVVDTNQRVYFDISPCGKYLVTGGTDGVLKVWDEDQVHWKSSLDTTDDQGDNATYKFPLHQDCCNSISLHPLRPILATGSGQYHIVDPLHSPEKKCTSGVMKVENGAAMTNTASNDESEKLNTDTNKTTNEMELDDNESDKDSEPNVDMKYSDVSENSLVFWWIGEVSDLT